jgi:hypothetical protein
VDLGSTAVYTMDQLGTWSDMGSAVILPDQVHEKNRNIFLRFAARVHVSFYHGFDV